MMRPDAKRKAFGQHFLKDQKVIDAIVSSFLEELKRHPEITRVLEIGPGQGALTHPLLEKCPPLDEILLIEKDRKLSQLWEKNPRAKLLCQDFLETSIPDWAPKNVQWGVLSNLPYSSGTAILTRLAEDPKRFPFMVLMFQEEVAMRVRAEPSTPDRGSLSLWIQNQWEVKKVIRVPPRSFSPAPRVFSEVLLLRAREQPMIGATKNRETLWEKCLSIAFRHRRKMLRAGALAQWPEGKAALARSGIDPSLRAEALHWEDWRKLFEALSQTEPDLHGSTDPL